MKYIYDITLNLNTQLINFYEWMDSDNLILCKKVPLFKVNEEVYNLIVNMSIIVDKTFLDSIYMDNNYLCVFATSYDSISCLFNKDGNIIKTSKLMLTDEEYLLNTIHNVKYDDFNYKKIDGNNNYSFNTRKENNILYEIEKYIIKNKDNKNEIEYLFLDMYNKKSNDYKELIDLIKDENQSRLEYLYKTIEILKINV